MHSSFKLGVRGLALTLATTLIISSTANAQFPFPAKESPAERSAAAPRLTPDAAVVSEGTIVKPTAAELRQARAMRRSQQRIERMERNLWAGYEPLRPNWNSIPMMSSRFPYQYNVSVPVYVYPW